MTKIVILLLVAMVVAVFTVSARPHSCKTPEIRAAMLAKRRSWSPSSRNTFYWSQLRKPGGLNRQITETSTTSGVVPPVPTKKNRRSRVVKKYAYPNKKVQKPGKVTTGKPQGLNRQIAETSTTKPHDVRDVGV